MEDGATQGTDSIRPRAQRQQQAEHDTNRTRRNSVASGSDRNPIIIGGLPSQVPDFDPEETQEWLDSLDAAVDERGRERARYLMLRLIERARERRVAVPEMRSTDYVNTIATKDEPFF